MPTNVIVGYEDKLFFISSSMGYSYSVLLIPGTIIIGVYIGGLGVLGVSPPAL